MVGLNCATGPADMGEALRYLSANNTLRFCQPNAGLPSVVEHGHALRPQTSGAPPSFLVGGCCGTTPAHMAAVVQRCAKAISVARTGTGGGIHLFGHAVPPGHLVPRGGRVAPNWVAVEFREAMLAADGTQIVA